MANGVNKVILIGRLGQDPETRFNQSGAAITNISIATSERWKDKNSGQMQEKTEWHRVVFFNKLAEIAGEYLKKGSNVYIEGKLQTRKWTDNNNVEKYSTEIIANSMQMLDSRGDSGNSNQNTRTNAQQNQRDNGAAQYQQNANAQNAAKSHSNYDDFDDDIPFN